MPETDRAKEYKAACDQLQSDRGSWVSTWQECMDRSQYGNEQMFVTESLGHLKKFIIYDTTAIQANLDMAAGLYSYLCSGQWFLIKAVDKMQNDRPEVKRWLMKATEILHESLLASNFPLVMVELLADFGALGTANMYIEKGRRSYLNFKNIHISQFAIAEDAFGRVDTVYRWFDLNAKQAIQMFGEDAVSEEIRKAYNEKKHRTTKKFEFIHRVASRANYDPDKIDNLSMPYESLYIEKKTCNEVLEEGYEDMPFLTPRFYKHSKEMYGRSSAMNVMTNIRLISRMVKSTIIGAEKRVTPPILMPNDGSCSPAITKAGGVMYFKPSITGQDHRPSVLDTHSDIGIGLEMEDRQRDIIQKAYFNDLFDVLGDKKNLTATEVLQRVEERLMLLGPVLGRLQSELFTPLIHRCLGILADSGALPDAPEDFDFYQIEYVSKLALTIKKLKIQAWMKTQEELAPLFEARPELLDNYDLDNIARGIGENNGMPADWLRPVKQRDAMRSARAAKQEQEEMLAQAAELAKGAGNLTKPMASNSPLGKFMEAA